MSMDWKPIDDYIDEIRRDFTERGGKPIRGERVLTPYLVSLLTRKTRPDPRDRGAIEFVIFDSLRRESLPEAEDGIE